MSGVRWTTGIGIALGGVGGAVAALLGAPARPSATPVAEAPVTSVHAATSVAAPAPVASPAPTPSDVPATAPSSSASGTAAAAPAPTAVASGGLTPAALELPTTLEALLRAEVLCDRKKQYDECSRAAEALEKGTASDVDLVQAKRFRKIALTHLVTECEKGDPHACFIMAAKYRTGTELKASPVRAEALEKRGIDLCRLRTAPECPAR
ncbi:MAG: hypothetical protein K0R38_4910 [Polyangiaceae bacterium]|nr:hypothetical protein [Polyangiaceae bacterium]